MSALIALDVALLLPPGPRETAIQASANLPAEESQGLRLDDEHLPHITLMQQFVRADEIEAALDRIDETLRGQRPVHVKVTGGGKSGRAVWMAIEQTDAIAGLHERLMEHLRGLERPAGTAAAFFEGDARVSDVAWVTGYRLKSSLSAYTPHVTLGHAAHPPVIAPFSFEAAAIAACHLGRFCSCRRVLRNWELI